MNKNNINRHSKIYRTLQLCIFFFSFSFFDIALGHDCYHLPISSTTEKKEYIQTLTDTCLALFNPFGYLKEKDTALHLGGLAACLLGISEEINDEQGIAYGNFFHGIATFYSNELRVTAIYENNAPYFLKALEFFEKSRIKEMEYLCYLSLSNNYRFGRSAKCVPSYQKAIEIGTGYVTPELLSSAYLGLALAHPKSYDDPYLAIDAYNKAYQLILSVKEASSSYLEYEEYAVYNLGKTYLHLKNYDQALNYFRLSLDIERKSKDQKGILWTESRIAAVYLSNGKSKEGIKTLKSKCTQADSIGASDIKVFCLSTLGEYYLQIEDYQESALYFDKILKLNLSEQFRRNSTALMTANYGFAQINLFRKNYDLAITYAQHALSNRVQVDSLRDKSIEVLKQAYTQKEDFGKALFYEQLQKDLSKITEGKTILDDKNKLEYKYESSLLKKELDITKIKDEFKGNQLFYSLIFIFALLILCIILLAYYFLIKKKNEHLQKQKQQIEQQKTALSEHNTLLKNKEELLLSMNKKLESYAHMVSHDLKAPLRNINGFSNLLRKKNENILNEESREYLDFIVQSSTKMGSLISNNLNVSLNKKMTYEHLNLNLIITEVFKVYHNEVKETKAKIHCEKLPFITGIRSEIRQLFQNLIENSLKYHRKGVPLKIEIKASQQVLTRGWDFTYSDNAQGMPEEYTHTVFNKYERGIQQNGNGLGIGLNTCKDIVRNYGGNISVDSKLGHGSSFYFSLGSREKFQSDQKQKPEYLI